MKSEDRQFFNQFIEVIAILVLVAIGLYWLATSLSSANESVDQRRVERASTQLEPEAMVLTESINVAAMAVEKPARSGSEMFTDFGCRGCHGTGNTYNAPAVGDTAAWQARLSSAGINGLVNSVMTGKGAMSGMGDYGERKEFRNAVDYMLELASITPPAEPNAIPEAADEAPIDVLEEEALEGVEPVEALEGTQQSMQTPAADSIAEQQNAALLNVN